MRIKFLLLCLLMAGLQGCVRATTAPSLPPMTYGTIQSPAEDAIDNSTYLDQQKASNKTKAGS